MMQNQVQHSKKDKGHKPMLLNISSKPIAGGQMNAVRNLMGQPGQQHEAPSDKRDSLVDINAVMRQNKQNQDGFDFVEESDPAMESTFASWFPSLWCCSTGTNESKSRPGGSSYSAQKPISRWH